MITAEVIAHISDRLAADRRFPDDIGKYTWGVVPVTCRFIDVQLEKPSAIVTMSGRNYRAELPDTVRIVINKHLPLTGVPNVTAVRLGFDIDARIVVYAVE